jgi:cytidine deaminase
MESRTRVEVISVGKSMEIDWRTLQVKATEAMKKSYSPYSKFPVGVAALVSDGRIISGCNVENASYGLTLCAECSLVSELIMSGGGRLIAAVCVDKDGNLLSPCGRCRQLLYEHGGDSLELLTPEGPKNMTVILPWGFGPKDLN